MSARAEAFRAAGSVLLKPVELPEAVGPSPGGRALLVGSRSDDLISKALCALRGAVPGLAVDVCGRQGLEARSLWNLRRRRYDIVCLLLTGEGRSREKTLALLSGARVALAFGLDGRWRQVHMPALRPASLQWWARLVLAGLLCLTYLRVTLGIAVLDAARRVIPVGPPAPDPGTPAGRQVTFIVPSYNQRDFMDVCLPPLLAEAGEEHQVILVDDGSNDDTTSYVGRRYPRVRVICMQRNRGFTGAVMAGIKACDTPLFALINSDVKVRPGFLSAMLPHFDAAETFAVCSRIDLPGGSQVETGNVAPAFAGILEPYHVAPTDAGPILYAGGASSLYHRARYQALGGFETIYRPFYWEDIELGYRAWRRGWRSLFEPGASVWHQRRACIGRRFGDAYADETFLKNALLFVWKNVRDRGLLAQHSGYVWARLISEILDGDGTMCRATLRALPLWGWLMLKRWGECRRGDAGDREILEMACPPIARAPGEPAPL
jgi:GT2 family glycosyltransferase